MKVHVKKNKKGKWFWHRTAGNGEIVSYAQSYYSKSNAVRAGRAEAKRARGKIVIED